MRTHDPYAGRCNKAIYLVRDVRSVLLSQYRQALRSGYRGDLESFLQTFTTGNVNPFCFWGDHVNFWLDSELAGSGRLFVVRFEALRQDTQAELSKLLDFLEVSVLPETIAEAIADNSLERMREKEDRASSKEIRNVGDRHRFVGEGSVTGWQGKLEPEQLRRLEEAARSALDRVG